MWPPTWSTHLAVVHYSVNSSCSWLLHLFLSNHIIIDCFSGLAQILIYITLPPIIQPQFLDLRILKQVLILNSCGELAELYVFIKCYFAKSSCLLCQYVLIYTVTSGLYKLVTFMFTCVDFDYVSTMLSS